MSQSSGSQISLSSAQLSQIKKHITDQTTQIQIRSSTESFNIFSKIHQRSLEQQFFCQKITKQQFNNKRVLFMFYKHSKDSPESKKFHQYLKSQRISFKISIDEFQRKNGFKVESENKCWTKNLATFQQMQVILFSIIVNDIPKNAQILFRILAAIFEKESVAPTQDLQIIQNNKEGYGSQYASKNFLSEIFQLEDKRRKLIFGQFIKFWKEMIHRRRIVEIKNFHQFIVFSAEVNRLKIKTQRLIIKSQRNQISLFSRSLYIEYFWEQNISGTGWQQFQKVLTDNHFLILNQQELSKNDLQQLSLDCQDYQSFQQSVKNRLFKSQSGCILFSLKELSVELKVMIKDWLRDAYKIELIQLKGDQYCFVKGVSSQHQNDDNAVSQITRLRFKNYLNLAKFQKVQDNERKNQIFEKLVNYIKNRDPQTCIYLKIGDKGQLFIEMIARQPSELEALLVETFQNQYQNYFEWKMKIDPQICLPYSLGSDELKRILSLCQELLKAQKSSLQIFQVKEIKQEQKSNHIDTDLLYIFIDLFQNGKCFLELRAYQQQLIQYLKQLYGKPQLNFGQKKRIKKIFSCIFYSIVKDSEQTLKISKFQEFQSLLQKSKFYNQFPRLYHNLCQIISKHEVDVLQRLFDPGVTHEYRINTDLFKEKLHEQYISQSSSNKQQEIVIKMTKKITWSIYSLGQFFYFQEKIKKFRRLYSVLTARNPNIEGLKGKEQLFNNSYLNKQYYLKANGPKYPLLIIEHPSLLKQQLSSGKMKEFLSFQPFQKKIIIFDKFVYNGLLKLKGVRYTIEERQQYIKKLKELFTEWNYLEYIKINFVPLESNCQQILILRVNIFPPSTNENDLE